MSSEAADWIAWASLLIALGATGIAAAAGRRGWLVVAAVLLSLVAGVPCGTSEVVADGSTLHETDKIGQRRATTFGTRARISVSS